MTQAANNQASDGKVYSFPSPPSFASNRGTGSTVSGGGGGGGSMDDMDARISKLEAIAEKTAERLGVIETRLTKLETRSETFATKSDVADAKVSIIIWVVSAIFIAQLLPAILKAIAPLSQGA